METLLDEEVRLGGGRGVSSWGAVFDSLTLRCLPDPGAHVWGHAEQRGGG